ncbi:MAG: DNA recombination protein RmuC [Bacteroidales bacterium]|jgi:DNA recombination protein RmuC|nr:DNA recombination protein RmuC [Bacteroidales bacterium]MDX9798027.1 DNA recombination protein RmuC [Bacteroidales bacterium]
MEFLLIIITLIAVIIVFVLVFFLLKKGATKERLTQLETSFSILESSSKTLESKNNELESAYNSAQRENSSLMTELNNNLERLQEERSKSLELSSQLEQERVRNSQLAIENSKILANNEALQEKQKDLRKEFEQLQMAARLEFEKTANEILLDKTSKFTEVNKVNIESLLKPLDLSIKEFRENVNKNLTEETKQRTSLEIEIKKIMEQTNLVSEQANNLASALKGENKRAGNWGENVLETILQNTGLMRGEHYTTQDVHYNEEDRKIIPDVIINLPDERKVIIDSKVSLVAYDNYFSSETEEGQKQELSKHIASIRQHISELSQKKYDQIKGSLGFVMMFVPIESAYLLAMQNDRELWNYAYKKNILLVSSTTLISTLRIFADLWRTDKLNKNAEKIIESSGKMYEKLMLFLESFEEIGDRLSKTHDTYNKAFNQLREGRGNLIKQAEDIKTLGVKTTKTLSEKFEDYDNEL